MDPNIHNIKYKDNYKKTILSEEMIRNENKTNIPMSYYFPEGKHKIPENIHPKYYKVMPNFNNYQGNVFEDYNQDYIVYL